MEVNNAKTETRVEIGSPAQSDDLERQLWENYGKSCEKSDTKFYAFGVLAAIFSVIATGNAGKFEVFGSSIEHPHALLGPLAALAAYQFYSAVTLACFAEVIWKELFRRDRIKNPEDLISAPSPARAKRKAKGYPDVFDLLQPPSIMRIVASRPFAETRDTDEFWGLLSWFIFGVGPCVFFVWAFYVLVRQDDTISWISSLLAFFLILRGVGIFWRTTSSGIW